MNKNGLLLTGGLLVVLGGFLLLASATYVLVLPSIYQSMARIALEDKLPTLDKTGTPYRDPFWLQSVFESIGSKSVLTEVITNLNLQTTWAPRFKNAEPLEVGAVYLLLKPQITIRQFRSTSLVDIIVRSESAGEAAAIANEIAKVYRKSRLEKHRQMAEFELKAWEEEAAGIQAKLDTVKTPSDPSDATPDKSSLENAEATLARLRQRIEKTKLNLARQTFPLPEIVDEAVPSSHSIPPKRWVGAIGMMIGLAMVASGAGLLWRARCLAAVVPSEVD